PGAEWSPPPLEIGPFWGNGVVNQTVTVWNVTNDGVHSIRRFFDEGAARNFADSYNAVLTLDSVPATVEAVVMQPLHRGQDPRPLVEECDGCDRRKPPSYPAASAPSNAAHPHGRTSRRSSRRSRDEGGSDSTAEDQHPP